ncbi:hypothetical protein Ea357_239 [Erwinia phage Ea35-70]|uniref:Uncharacterized protein n=10 Tax=Agricanvirus TaxID=1984776 RepID=W6ARX6_9CAUD|nr:hypothetical protein Ea357_239 [Erwinia phage Ea35-70]AHI60392.1 hypothetical protein Ea357_239 [Erwinia phage Ea35-70]QBP07348.1 hypothetical protein REBECCA_243 [Erwinia phage Rebecca]
MPSTDWAIAHAYSPGYGRFKRRHFRKNTRKRPPRPCKNKSKLMKVAQSKLGYAIMTGRVIRQAVCDECEADERIEPLQVNYAKPYIVLWLCPRCHADWYLTNEPAYS